VMDSRHNSESVASGRSVLEARGLKKTYGTREKNLEVLVDANLELREGEMVAVVAPSGAGKSTLLHLLAALDTPTSGTVYLKIKRLKRRKTRRSRNTAIAPWVSLAEASIVAGFYGDRERGDAAAGARRATGSRAAGSAQVAGGGRSAGAGRAPRRRTFGRGTAARCNSPGARHRAKVLLADEPTGDLDEQNAWAVFGLLQRLHRAHRLTSLIATHNLALAERCDRILALEHGILRTRAVKAEARGTPGEKRANRVRTLYRESAARHIFRQV